MINTKTITKTALAIATLLGGAQAFAASYPVLGNTPGAVLIVDDGVKYGTASGASFKPFIFEYEGGSEAVRFTLTDLVIKKSNGTLLDDTNGGIFKLEEVAWTPTTLTLSNGSTYKTETLQVQSVISAQELLQEGQSFKATLTTGSLYKLSFVFNDANCINVGGNIADFKISTVPVPGSALFFASSLIGAGLWRRRMGSAAS